MVGCRASTSTTVAAARFRARLAGEPAIEVRAQARPFAAADLAAALATCRQPPPPRPRAASPTTWRSGAARLDAVIAVDDAADVDRVFVRRGNTNQEGETRDVRWYGGLESRPDWPESEVRDLGRLESGGLSGRAGACPTSRRPARPQRLGAPLDARLRWPAA